MPESLQQRMQAHAFTEAEVRALARELLVALREARHGDIGPAKIIFDDDGHARLIEPGGGREDLGALAATLVQLLPRARSPALQRLLDNAYPTAAAALAELDARRRASVVPAASALAVVVVVAGAAAWWASWVTPARAGAGAPSPAPAAAPEPPPGRPRPASSSIPFSWQLARWDFEKLDGDWLRDDSGHGHDVKLPSTGYRRDRIFGRDWSGEQPPITAGDHPDFAPETPFHIDAVLMFSEQPAIGPAHLLRRVGDGGRVAWALDLLPGDVLRFSIGDASGKTAAVKGALPPRDPHQRSTFSVYANFDSSTGELALFAQCRELGRTTTDARPATQLPGAHLELLDGYSGYLMHLSFERGLMLPDGPLDKHCRFVGSKLDDPAVAAAQGPQTIQADGTVVEPATGQGILRARLGDSLEYDFTHWQRDFEEKSSSGTLKVRRVGGPASFAFEATVRVTGEVKHQGTALRYGPIERSRLYAYAPGVVLEKVRYPPDGPRDDLGPCTVAAHRFRCRQAVEPDNGWKRRLDESARELALSSGVIESGYGDREQTMRTLHDQLSKIGRGPETTALREATLLTETSKTPYVTTSLFATEVEREAEDALWSKGGHLHDGIEDALDGCSDVKIQLRQLSQQIIARFERGRLVSLERVVPGDAQPPAATLACLRAALAKSPVDDALVSTEVTWTHEGPETQWEKTARQVATDTLMAAVMLCLDSEDLLVSLSKAAKKVSATAQQSRLISLKISGAPTPAGLVTCVSDRLAASPVPGQGEISVEVPLKAE